MAAARLVSTIAIASAIAMSTSGSVHAKRKRGPTQVVPPKKKKDRPNLRRVPPGVDASEGGQRQGAPQIALGSIMGAMAVILVGRGAWEITEARRLARECDEDDVELGCAYRNPPLHPGVAAGLSFGLAIPLGVVGGLLLGRGIRIHRDYETFRKAHPEVAVGPWSTGAGGGVAVRGRF